MPKRYIHGKFANAACDLADELSRLGIKHSGVGYASTRGPKELIVLLVRAKDRANAPKTFREFTVKYEVTGVARPAREESIRG